MADEIRKEMIEYSDVYVPNLLEIGFNFMIFNQYNAITCGIIKHICMYRKVEFTQYFHLQQLKMTHLWGLHCHTAP
jgi:hypothetical protein